MVLKLLDRFAGQRRCVSEKNCIAMHIVLYIKGKERPLVVG